MKRTIAEVMGQGFAIASVWLLIGLAVVDLWLSAISPVLLVGLTVFGLWIGAVRVKRRFWGSPPR